MLPFEAAGFGAGVVRAYGRSNDAMDPSQSKLRLTANAVSAEASIP